METELIDEVKHKEISNALMEFLSENNLHSIIDALRKVQNSNDYFDLSVEDKTKISYLRGDRIPDDSDMIYDLNYRKKYAYHTRIGKLLNGAEYNQDEYKRACELLFRRGKNYEVELTSSIGDSYHEDSYYELRGDLGNSCMRHDNCQDAISFYQTIAPNVVQLAVIRDSQTRKILARGLLWKAVKLNTSENCNWKDSPSFKYITYLDRVYAVDSNIASSAYAWADSKGYYHWNKKPNGEMRIDIPINARDTSEPMPYFDTFRYCDEGLRYLSNYGGDVCLDSTDCDSVDDLTNGRYSCAECGARIHEDDCNYVEDLGDCCDDCAVYSDVYETCIINNDNAVHSDNLNSWIYSDDENYRYSEYAQDYFHCDDVIYCEYESDYIYSDDAVELHTGDYTHHENAVEWNGEFYLIDDCKKDSIGEWIPKNESEEIENEIIV
jgi:hypothetical protein